MTGKMNLKGRKFARLTVVEDTGKRQHSHVIWKCLCDCGKNSFVSTNHLRTGHTKSCGCYSKERTAEVRRVDIRGKKFGRLLALQPTKRRAGHNIIWKFKCDCGTIAELPANRVMNGNTSSCGCLQKELTAKRVTTHGMSKTKAYINESGRRARAKRYEQIQGAVISLSEIDELIQEADGRCVYCGAPYEHLDHVRALGRGGKHTIDNLAPACAYCNQTKNDKLVGLEWMPSIERIMKMEKLPSYEPLFVGESHG